MLHAHTPRIGKTDNALRLLKDQFLIAAHDINGITIINANKTQGSLEGLLFFKS